MSHINIPLTQTFFTPGSIAYPVEQVIRLRRALREEADLVGVESVDEWVANSVTTILKMYEDGLLEYKAQQAGPEKNDTIGFLYEFNLPSGKSLRLGESRFLERANNTQNDGGLEEPARRERPN